MKDTICLTLTLGGLSSSVQTEISNYQCNFTFDLNE